MLKKLFLVFFLCLGFTGVMSMLNILFVIALIIDIPLLLSYFSMSAIVMLEGFVSLFTATQWALIWSA